MFQTVTMSTKNRLQAYLGEGFGLFPSGSSNQLAPRICAPHIANTTSKKRCISISTNYALLNSMTQLSNGSWKLLDESWCTWIIWLKTWFIHQYPNQHLRSRPIPKCRAQVVHRAYACLDHWNTSHVFIKITKNWHCKLERISNEEAMYLRQLTMFQFRGLWKRIILRLT